MTTTPQPAASVDSFASHKSVKALGLDVSLIEMGMPVQQELTSVDLRVTGTIPDYLDGRYLRNGPNSVAEIDPATYHFFSGDAMVHGVSLRDGKAQWYRNRWVRTPAVARALGEPSAAIIKPRAGSTSFSPNTSVICHADRTLALVEGGMACYELTDELDTLGTCDFDGTLSGGYTAHPKIDLITGEMHAVSYSFARANTIQYSIIGVDGRARRTVDITVGGATFMHDFTLTDKYVVFYDLPVTLNAAQVVQYVPLARPLRKPAELVLQALIGRVKIPGPLTTRIDRFTRVKPAVPYTWNPNYQTRIGVMPREGGNADVRWFDIPPCYVFHSVNGYSETREGSEVIVLDLVRYETMFKTDLLAPTDSPGLLNRWTVDLSKSTVHMEQLDDRGKDFPKINETLAGKKYRYAYIPNIGELIADHATPATCCDLLKVDYQTGALQTTALGPEVVFGEMSFVPNPSGVAEDDGVLIGYVADRGAGEGRLLILDAPTLEPMASVHLPQRVPVGFHGTWAPR